MLRLRKQSPKSGDEGREETMTSEFNTPEAESDPYDESDPAHYSNLPIEPWDFIQKNKLDFFEGNVVKYICRWKNKGGVDDLQKAITYINKIISGESK
jgi:hypothetical protein|tara:strand:+ start:70 stop:363 length:294 start_codon:yes stop_codon:yes gene_type:complete